MTNYFIFFTNCYILLILQKFAPRIDVIKYKQSKNALYVENQQHIFKKKKWNNNKSVITQKIQDPLNLRAPETSYNQRKWIWREKKGEGYYVKKRNTDSIAHKKYYVKWKKNKSHKKISGKAVFYSRLTYKTYLTVCLSVCYFYSHDCYILYFFVLNFFAHLKRTTLHKIINFIAVFFFAIILSFVTCILVLCEKLFSIYVDLRVLIILCFRFIAFFFCCVVCVCRDSSYNSFSFFFPSRLEESTYCSHTVFLLSKWFFFTCMLFVKEKQNITKSRQGFYSLYFYFIYFFIF